MKTSVTKIIKSKKWQHYLTRPNSIFDASTWHLWYSSETAEKIWKQTFPDAFFVEETHFNIRAYRPKSQVRRLLSFIEGNSYDSKRLANTLNKAEYYNAQAKKYIAKTIKPRSFQSAMEFYIKLAIYGVVMMSRIGVIEGAEKKVSPRLMKKVIKLRAVSHYPIFLEKIIKPTVASDLGKDRSLIDYMTLNEFYAGDLEKARERKRLHEKGHRFLYWLHERGEEIYFAKDPNPIIRKLEPELTKSSVRGHVAFRGKVRGIVRIVRSESLAKIKFNKGNILVSPTTNPVLLPIMKKAGAIITDEGGLMSHAAIVSRELKTPCIIATGNATRSLKDGDMVEVDAIKGIVRKITN